MVSYFTNNSQKKCTVNAVPQNLAIAMFVPEKSERSSNNSVSKASFFIYKLLKFSFIVNILFFSVLSSAIAQAQNTISSGSFTIPKGDTKVEYRGASDGLANAVGRDSTFNTKIQFSASNSVAKMPNRTVKFSPPISGVANFDSITTALRGAASGTIIWVAAGTIKEPELIIPVGVTVIGGFPANSTSMSNRIYPGAATTSQKTILDGSYKHRVATIYGTLDGCVITRGYTYDVTSDNSKPMTGNGGGVMINGGTVQNCILHDNVAAKLASSPGTIPGTFVASIGDIYCTDGTLLHPTYSLNSSGQIVAALSGGVPSGKTPQGIVFYVDTSPTTGHFLIMGKVTTNALAPWFNPTFDFPLANITTLTDAMADFNGKSNSTSLDTQFKAWHAANPSIWYEGWDNDNPVPYTLNYNTPSGTLGDWYLPAAGELYKIWEVYSQMDASAHDILGWISGSGSTMFPKNFYWSSSEYDSNSVWGLDTYSYPWGSWGLSARGKTQGGYTIPIASKTLTTQ